MRTFLVFLALMLTVVGVVWAQEEGSPGIGDEFYPLLGNGGYDVQHYTIDLDVSDDMTTLDGFVVIEALATQDLSQFNLDFIGMTVESVTVDGAEASFERDGAELVITPAVALESGALFSTTVEYNGVPGRDSEGESINFNGGWYAYRGGALVASQPDGSRQWFPCNDHPLDKATFSLKITVAPTYQVASNGEFTSVYAEGDRLTYEWEMRQPMATYLTTVNIHTFDVRTDESASGIPIRNYFPVDLADEAEALFAPQAEMIDYFEGVFGPYPYDYYGSVVANVQLGFALETQTMSLFGRDIVTTGWGGMAESVIAHELAHHWVGNSVSPATWRDLWLSEGFASYAQILWEEHLNGRAAADEMVEGFYAEMSNPMMAANLERRGVAAPANPTPDALFNSSVYTRGALALHALRLQMGDEAFFTFVRKWVSLYTFSTATTQDLIDLAVEVSGDESIRDLMDAWLYQDPLPDIPQMRLFGTRED